MLLSIDPGTTKSGWCVTEGDRVIESGIMDNQQLVDSFDKMVAMGDRVAIEVFEARGMPIGNDSIETILWTGQFIRECEALGATFVRVHRSRVKLHLCGSAKAKDSNIRQALLDKLGPQGTKKNPGPTYGVSSHAWAALAVAVTATETMP